MNIHVPPPRTEPTGPTPVLLTYSDFLRMRADGREAGFVAFDETLWARHVPCWNSLLRLCRTFKGDTPAHLC